MRANTLDAKFLEIDGQGASGGSNPNLIINGNFDIWQRGTSQVNTSAYASDDRWINGYSGPSTTCSRQSFTIGQTDVPNNPDYYSRTVVTLDAASASFYVVKAHRIESVKTLSGKTATLSFWAKADASKDLATEFQQGFGTGGSPSSTLTTIGVTTHSLTTSWQKFTVTVDIPSISGKTLGTSGNDYLTLNFWFYAGSDYNSQTNSIGYQSGTFDIAQVKLEEGSIATPFIPRSFGEELALCQRYYYTTFPNDTKSSTAQATPHFYCENTNVAIGAFAFPVTMRVTPTVYLYSPVGGNLNKVENIGNIEIAGTSSLPGISKKGAFQVNNDGTNFTVGEMIQWGAYFDAEL